MRILFDACVRSVALAALVATSAGIAPASAAVVSSLQPGAAGQYIATLRDTGLAQWEGGDLQIDYAASAFRFVSGTVGDLDPANFIVSFGTEQVDTSGHATLLASISHGLADVATGDLVVLRLVFDALGDAVPGAAIRFTTADPSLYDFTPSSAAISGSTVPEGNSALLSAAALLALFASTRQRLR